LKVTKTELEDVVVLEPARFKDARGFFSESWNRQLMADAALDIDWVQDNHSLSTQTGTVRGLHFQAPPHAQAKLVRCGQGALFDVAVDIRLGSPTFGKWTGVELSAENGKQFLIPAGFLHGFVTRLPNTEVVYKCSDYYAPECDGAVRFDCPDIAINWGFGEGVTPVLSGKDANAPQLSDFESPFVYES
jgi:dTDP-4-dehydrorhamnose 3,5-epimerase